MRLQQFLAARFFSSVTLFGTSVFYIFVLFFLARVDFSVFVRVLAAMLVVEVASGIIKLVFPKGRPVLPAKGTAFWERWENGSFPSTHTARVAALATALSILYRDEWLVAAGIFISASVAYSRVYLKKHDWKDVFAGLLLGVVLGALAAVS